jgi:hypothetical protein
MIAVFEYLFGGRSFVVESSLGGWKVNCRGSGSRKVLKENANLALWESEELSETELFPVCTSVKWLADKLECHPCTSVQ